MHNYFTRPFRFASLRFLWSTWFFKFLVGMRIENRLYLKLGELIYPQYSRFLTQENSTYLGTTLLKHVPDSIDEFFRIRYLRFARRVKWFLFFRNLVEDLFISSRFVSYAEYQTLFSSSSSKEYVDSWPKYPVYRLLGIRSERQKQQAINAYPNSLDGYFLLMEKKNKRLFDLFHTPQHVRFPDSTKDAHSYALGGTKSGKSELLKHLLLQEIGRNDKAVILIEPNGDLAEQVARQTIIDKERLIYIDLSFLPHTPSINPFEFITQDNDLDREKQTQIIRIALVQMMKLDGAPLTLQMQSVLQPCLEVVSKAGGTLRDVQRMMVPGMGDDLFELGCSMQKYKDFFLHTFNNGNLTVSKQGIFQKLMNVLNLSTFQHFFCGTSTIDLVQAITDKKVIVFNLSKGKLGAIAAEYIGKMLLAILQNIIFQRASIPEKERVPIALYIDEFQDLITESVEDLFVQGRKYKVSLTVASQVLGQKMSADMTKIVLGNTNVKFVGRNGFDTLRAMSKEAFTSIDTLKELSTGTFYTTIDKAHGFLLQVPVRHLGLSTCIDDTDWHKLLSTQIATWYKPRPRPGEGSGHTTRQETEHIPLPPKELKQKQAQGATYKPLY